MALVSVTEFFRNLPPKQCAKCGHEVNEMHESYTHKCEKCETKELN